MARTEHGEVCPVGYEHPNHLAQGHGCRSWSFSTACAPAVSGLCECRIHPPEGALQSNVREDCHTVLHSLSVVDYDLVSGKVEVLDAKTEAFHESQTAAVEDLGYHLVYSR